MNTVQWVFEDTLTDTYILGKTALQVGICEGLAVMFFLIATVYNVVVNTIHSFGLKPLDISAFGRTVVLMFVVLFYIPLISFPIGVVSVVYKLTETTYEEERQLGEMIIKSTTENGFTGQLQKDFKNDDTKPAPEATDPEAETMSLWDYMGTMLSPATLSAMVLDGLAIGIAQVVRVVIEELLKYLGQLFFILGPYAFAAAILPIWRDKAVVFFNTLITIYFSMVIMNIMDGVMLHNLANDIDTAGMEMHKSFSMNIVLIVCYLLPMWIAGKLVGSSDAGRFLSMFAQTATAVAGTKLAQFGFGKIAAGGGGASNAAAASKDAMSTK